jgi:hypothetical protein
VHRTHLSTLYTKNDTPLSLHASTRGSVVASIETSLGMNPILFLWAELNGTGADPLRSSTGVPETRRRLCDDMTG